MKFSYLIKKSRIIGSLLTIAIVLGSLINVSCTAQAADSEDSVFLFLNVQDGSAVAREAEKHAFSITASTYAAIEVVVPSAVGMSIQVIRTSDSHISYDDTITSSTADWDYDDSKNFYYYFITWESPVIADYTISLTFDTDTEYLLLGAQSKPHPSISDKSIILTKGFSQTLSVSNATVSKWTSSKPSVAAVDSKGKVIGKSVGSATITATTTDGQKVSCTVTVKANTYTNPAMNFSETQYGHAYIDITKVSYNNKGDLVIKAIYLNNCGRKITQINNLKITVKNKNGKVIGTFNQKLKNVSISHGGSKSFIYTIKKSQLKQKKIQNLRNASVKPSWRYHHSLY